MSEWMNDSFDYNAQSQLHIFWEFDKFVVPQVHSFDELIIWRVWIQWVLKVSIYYHLTLIFALILVEIGIVYVNKAQDEISIFYHWCQLIL